jgi:outer membrane protein assembly factor BamB/tetratricopeptide (TPR) repeat protein
MKKTPRRIIRIGSSLRLLTLWGWVVLCLFPVSAIGNDLLAEYHAVWVRDWEVVWRAGETKADISVGAVSLRAPATDLRLGKREIVPGTNLIPVGAQGKDWVLIDARAKLRWTGSGPATCSIDQQPAAESVDVVATALNGADLAKQKRPFRFLGATTDAMFLRFNEEPISLPPGAASASVQTRPGENTIHLTALVENPASLQVRVSSYLEEEVALAEMRDRVADPSRNWREKNAAWNGAAEIHRFRGRLSDAARALERAAELEESAEARYQRRMDAADLYARVEAPHLEVQALEKALDVIPAWDPRHRSTASRLAEIQAEQLCRIVQATELLERVHRAHGNDTDAPGIRIQLARIYLNAGMNDEALKHYRLLLNESSDPELRRQAKKGVSLCQTDRINKPILPSRVEMGNELGLYFQKAREGQWEEAFAHLERILERYSDAVVETSAFRGWSAREEVRRELAKIGPAPSRSYVEAFGAALAAAVESGVPNRVERFRFAHPFAGFECILDDAIAGLLAQEGNLARAAAFYERAARSAEAVSVSGFSSSGDVAPAELGAATLTAKTLFSRLMAGETPSHVLADEIESSTQQVDVAGRRGTLAELTHEWRPETTSVTRQERSTEPLSQLVHSVLPLLRAPLILRKWQVGWIPHGPHNMPPLAQQFIPYVPCGDSSTVFLNTSEVLHAVDPRSGRLLWTRGPSEAYFADPPPRSLENISLAAVGKRFSVAFSSEAVFYRLNWAHRSTGERRSVIFAARREDGILLWCTAGHPTLDEAEFTSDPVYADGTVIVTAWQTHQIPTFLLIGLDAQSGEMLWQAHLFSGSPFPWVRDGPFIDTPMGAAPPTIDGQVAYYCSGAGVMAAVDILDGSILWVSGYPRVYSWGPDDLGGKVFLSKPASPVAVTEDTVVVAPQDSHHVLFLERDTGWEKGRFTSPNLRFLIGIREGLALVQLATEIVALRIEDGSTAWRRELPVSGIVGAPSLSRRGVLCPGWEGLFVLNPASGEPVEEYPWHRRVAFGNVLDLGDRLLGVSHATVHFLSPAPMPEADWWVPRSAETGPVVTTVPSRETSLLRWILPAVDRGDFHFDPDAPKLMLLRASESVEMRVRDPVPSLLWERATFNYPDSYQFNEQTLVLTKGRDVHVIDVETGDTLWRRNCGNDIGSPRFTGAFPDREEILAYAGSVAVCYRRDNGERLWQAVFPAKVVRGIRPLDNSVGIYAEAVGENESDADRGEAILLDRPSGSVIRSIPIAPQDRVAAGGHLPCWMVASHRADDASGAALDEILVGQRYLARVDWETGGVRFGLPLKSVIPCPSARLQHYGNYVAAQGEDGSIGVLWNKSALLPVDHPPTVRWHILDNVFYYAADQRFYAYDLERGTAIWRSRPFRHRVDAIVATGDSVLAAMRNVEEKGPGAGEVMALDRASGEFQSQASSLTAYYHKSGRGGDRLFASDYTYLYCFGPPGRSGSRTRGKITVARKEPDPDSVAGLKTAADVEEHADGRVRLSEVSPRIDGSLDDWNRAAWVTLEGAADWHPDHVHYGRRKSRGAQQPEQESARVAIAELPECVCIAARVRDDLHVAPSRRSLWRGDSVLLAFLQASPVPTVQAGPLVYTIALVDGVPCVVGGPIHDPRPVPLDPCLWPTELRSLVSGATVPWIRRWQTEAQAEAGKDAVQVAAIRNEREGETLYEIRLPRPLLPTGRLRLWDIAVHDDDGYGRRGCLQLASGVWSVEGTAGYARWPEN